MNMRLGINRHNSQPAHIANPKNANVSQPQFSRVYPVADWSCSFPEVHARCETKQYFDEVCRLTVYNRLGTLGLARWSRRHAVSASSSFSRFDHSDGLHPLLGCQWFCVWYGHSR